MESKVKRLKSTMLPAFDLSAVERASREVPSDMAVNAATCHPMSRINDYLFIGSWKDATDAELLASNGITHVLNVALELLSEEEQLCIDGNSDVVSKCIPLKDSHNQEIEVFLLEAFEFIAAATHFTPATAPASGATVAPTTPTATTTTATPTTAAAAASQRSTGRVLVHCRRGISRSAAIVVAFLMAFEKLSFDSALAFVQSKRPCVSLNLAFSEILREYKPPDLVLLSSPSPSDGHYLQYAVDHKTHTNDTTTSPTTSPTTTTSGGTGSSTAASGSPDRKAPEAGERGGGGGVAKSPSAGGGRGGARSPPAARRRSLRVGEWEGGDDDTTAEPASPLHPHTRPS